MIGTPCDVAAFRAAARPAWAGLELRGGQKPVPVGEVPHGLARPSTQLGHHPCVHELVGHKLGQQVPQVLLPPGAGLIQGLFQRISIPLYFIQCQLALDQGLVRPDPLVQQQPTSFMSVSSRSGTLTTICQRATVGPVRGRVGSAAPVQTGHRTPAGSPTESPSSCSLSGWHIR